MGNLWAVMKGFLHGSGVTWLLGGRAIADPRALFGHGRRKWIMRFRYGDIDFEGWGVRINLTRRYSSRRLSFTSRNGHAQYLECVWFLSR